MQGMWHDLGEYAPDSSSPFDQDPFQMSDLKDPSQPAGPFEGLGSLPPGMTAQQFSQASPQQIQSAYDQGGSGAAPGTAQMWQNVGQQVGAVVSGVGDVLTTQAAMKEAQKMAQKGGAVVPQQGFAPMNLPPAAAGLSTRSIVLMVLGGALVVGLGVWLIMKKKRRR